MDNTTALVISILVILFGTVISLRIWKCIQEFYLEMRACVTYRAVDILYPEVTKNEDHLNDLSHDGERMEDKSSSPKTSKR